MKVRSIAECAGCAKKCREKEKKLLQNRAGVFCVVCGEISFGKSILGTSEGRQAAPVRCEKCAGRSCIRFGPRLRTRSKRIRSSKSAGAYIPRARNTSACDS
jgi:hypothetical protein